ncbi:hypothetical protein [Rhizobium leguminosarum]|nr:hypothetical protein [Rhizobium leguminosarum]MBP2444079.1 hypothetical protein [Rhizobium leguminosarum]
MRKKNTCAPTLDLEAYIKSVVVADAISLKELFGNSANAIRSERISS